MNELWVQILGIDENMCEALAAHERACKAHHRVLLYDPKMLERYPGGVIAEPAS